MGNNKINAGFFIFLFFFYHYCRFCSGSTIRHNPASYYLIYQPLHVYFQADADRSKGTHRDTILYVLLFFEIKEDKNQCIMLIWESNKNVLWNFLFYHISYGSKSSPQKSKEVLSLQKGVKTLKETFELYFILFLITDNSYIFKGKDPLGGGLREWLILWYQHLKWRGPGTICRFMTLWKSDISSLLLLSRGHIDSNNHYLPPFA